MDLIYMNSDMEDMGVLMGFEMDLAFGTDENDFECQIPSSAHCCEAGWYLYADGTEYGGIIDSIEVNSESETITYKGRTYHGILNSKVIVPDTGKPNRTLSGEANTVLGTLLADLALADLFEVSVAGSGLTLDGYEMDGYSPAYDAIKKMLESVGGKLLFKFENGKIILAAAAVRDYSKDEEFDTDLVGFTIQKNYKTVNHLICIGGGDDDQESKIVIHLYADSEGAVGDVQTLFGLDEYTSVHESSSTDEDELRKEGTEKLTEFWKQSEMAFSLDDDSSSYDVGDRVGAYDSITGIAEVATIRKKIVKLTDSAVEIQYEVSR